MDIKLEMYELRLTSHYDKVVKVRKVSDRVKVVVLVFEDVLNLACGQALQNAKHECNMQSKDGLGDFNVQVGRHIDGHVGVGDDYGVAKSNQ